MNMGKGTVGWQYHEEMCLGEERSDRLDRQRLLAFDDKEDDDGSDVGERTRF